MKKEQKLYDRFPKVKFYHPKLSNISLAAQIGEGTVIHSHVSIHDTAKIGRNCQIEAGVFIPNGVTLEDGVFCAPNVVFTNDPTMAVERSKWHPTATLVKSGARIGANATIRAGVVVGTNSVIGCGSVVLKDVPDGATVVGNPARKMNS